MIERFTAFSARVVIALALAGVVALATHPHSYTTIVGPSDGGDFLPLYLGDLKHLPYVPKDHCGDVAIAPCDGAS